MIEILAQIHYNRMYDSMGSPQKRLTMALHKAIVFFLFYRFFSQKVRVGGRNKNKNKIHSDRFPAELKSKETQFRVSFDFNSVEKWSE